MNYKQNIKNIVLKGLYIGIVYSAFEAVLPYVVFKLVKYEPANFMVLTVLLTIVQIITTAVSYAIVSVIIKWHASRRNKTIMICLSVLIAVGLIAYNYVSLYATRG